MTGGKLGGKVRDGRTCAEVVCGRAASEVAEVRQLEIRAGKEQWAGARQELVRKKIQGERRLCPYLQRRARRVRGSTKGPPTQRLSKQKCGAETC